MIFTAIVSSNLSGCVGVDRRIELLQYDGCHGGMARPVQALDTWLRSVAHAAEDTVKIFLDDEWELPDRYPGDEWVCVRTVEDARHLLVRHRGEVTHLSLDHDLGDGEFEGHHLTRWLLEELNSESPMDFYPTEEITIHSRNPVGRLSMESDLLHRLGKPWLYRKTGF